MDARQFNEREDIAMLTPKVTEIRRPLEAVTADPFIAGLPSAPRPTAAA